MSFTGHKLEDRRTAAADAKKAMLAKFQARPKADDPEMLKRAAERQAIAEAREVRMAQREEERRLAAEKAAQEAAERAAAEREAARTQRASFLTAYTQDRMAKRNARAGGKGR